MLHTKARQANAAYLCIQAVQSAGQTLREVRLHSIAGTGGLNATGRLLLLACIQVLGPPPGWPSAFLDRRHMNREWTYGLDIWSAAGQVLSVPKAREVSPGCVTATTARPVTTADCRPHTSHCLGLLALLTASGTGWERS